MTEYEQALKDAGIVNVQDGYMRGYSDLDVLMEWWKKSLCPRPKTREDYIHQFSFAIPDELSLALIGKYAPIVEMGAGSGYWAYELKKKGINVIATDKTIFKDIHPEYKFNKVWTHIEEMSGMQATKAYPDRALLVVWPP